jgi:hypothetical protein
MDSAISHWIHESWYLFTYSVCSLRNAVQHSYQQMKLEMCSAKHAAMYVCIRGTASSPCTATITDLLYFPFGLTIYESHTSNELQDLAYGGIIIVTWLYKNWPRWQNHKWAIASQSRRTCMADPSSSRHLSHMGSSISPSLKRCPFRWQCPINGSTIHLNWSLLSFNRSFGKGSWYQFLCPFESRYGFPLFDMKNMLLTSIGSPRNC